jgi:hypothetical protein
MKTEIKNVIEDLVTSVLSSIGDQVKGETKDTRENIITRNTDVALLKVNQLLKTAKTNIVTKMRGKSGDKSLISVLNDEL